MKIRNLSDAIKFSALWSGGKSAPTRLRKAAMRQNRLSQACLSHNDGPGARARLDAARLLDKAADVEEEKSGSFVAVEVHPTLPGFNRLAFPSVRRATPWTVNSLFTPLGVPDVEEVNEFVHA